MRIATKLTSATATTNVNNLDIAATSSASLDGCLFGARLREHGTTPWTIAYNVAGAASSQAMSITPAQGYDKTKSWDVQVYSNVDVPGDSPASRKDANGATLSSSSPIIEVDAA